MCSSDLENNTMLGSKTDCAFKIGDNNTTYFGKLSNNFIFFDNKLSFFIDRNIACSIINENNNSLIKNVNDLLSTSLSFGLNYAINPSSVPSLVYLRACYALTLSSRNLQHKTDSECSTL